MKKCNEVKRKSRFATKYYHLQIEMDAAAKSKSQTLRDA